MAYFDFSNLIRKYMTSFTALIPADGYKDNRGVWVAGEPTERTLHGAIISMRESRLIRSQGVYTSQDRALYMLEPLEKALDAVFIIHDGRKYSIASELENAEFTGVYAYVLKYVSVFDNGGGASG